MSVDSMHLRVKSKLSRSGLRRTSETPEICNVDGVESEEVVEPRTFVPNIDSLLCTKYVNSTQHN